MILFVVTEIMFFAGMFSAFMIAEGMAVDGWPPAGQPRLPVEATAFNTLALLASGALLFVAGKRFATDPRAARNPMIAALALGAFFVVFQGVEWVQLVGEGLTLTTSTHGSFFYVMVGIHAIHAVAAILSLLWAVRRHRKGLLHASQLTTVQVFWYFVVGIWPILYFQIYL
jgi:cytochrome c oxidase subunit 3